MSAIRNRNDNGSTNHSFLNTDREEEDEEDAAAAAAAEGKGKNDMVLYMIYINIILYSLCFQMQRPLEPYLVGRLVSGDSKLEFAKLNSFFSVVQMVGSLIAGRFLDKFGARIGFVINFLASACSYYLLSQATTINILYLSKIPTVFQCGFLCAQTAASQLTSNGQDRVVALGRLTLAYNIGTIIGPALGGYIGTTGDYYLGAKIAIIGSLISVVLSLLVPNVTPSSALSTSAYSPTSISSKSTSEEDEDEGGGEGDALVENEATRQQQQARKGTYAAIIESVGFLLLTKIFTSIANSMRESTFPLVMKDFYKLKEDNLGYIMSAMSFLNSICNGFLLAPISKYLNNDLNILISWCLFVMSISSGLQMLFALPSAIAFSPYNGFVEYLIFTLFLVFAQYIMSTTLTGESTARVDPGAKGTLIGLEHSLFAGVRVFSPLLGTTLLVHGPSAVSGACYLVFSSVYAAWRLASKITPTAVRATPKHDNEERKER